MAMGKRERLQELAEFCERTEHAPEKDWLEHIERAVLAGQADITMKLVAHALDDGIDADAIAHGPMEHAMKEASNSFKNGKFFVPEILTSSRALEAALFEIEKRQPKAGGRERDSRMPTVLVGTVRDDFHDIGKNLAACMFRARGYHVIDLGVNVPPEKFTEAAKEHHPDVIGLSAGLTTTVGELGHVIDALEAAGIRDGLEVYVSGVPVTQKLADEVGADKYCADLSDSLDYLEEFVLE